MPNPEILNYIYDRYGKLVKQLTNGKGWDGTFNGNPLPLMIIGFL
jgi:gliding motility-associated-like protein